MHNMQFRILVADDDPGHVEWMKEILGNLARQQGHAVEVAGAYSALDVIESSQKRSFDVLFLDFHFERGMNGEEILQRLPDPFGQRFTVIVSGWSEVELEGLIARQGRILGDRFLLLPKPLKTMHVKGIFPKIEAFIRNRRVPNVIEEPYSRTTVGSSYRVRLDAVANFYESVARFTIAVLMSDLKRIGCADDIYPNIRFNFNLTMGAWFSWLRAVVDAAMRNKSSLLVSELVDVFAGEGEKTHIAEMYHFKDKVRDRLSHAPVVDDRMCFKHYENFRGHVETLREALTFCARYPMILVEDIDFGADSVDPGKQALVYDYDVKCLMGANSSFNSVRVSSSQRLRKDQVYLFGTNQIVLSLDPFFKYSLCETCQQARLFAMQKLIGQKEFEFVDSSAHSARFLVAERSIPNLIRRTRG